MTRRMQVLSMICLMFIAGCGYTTQSLLPSNFKTIYVDNFANMISVTAEQSDARMYRGYRPGMEIEITKAVRDRYIFDGNLKIANEDASDIMLSGALTDFRREPLRYDRNDNVEEYRIKITVEMELKETKTGKKLWRENAFSGETTYRTGGSLAKSEAAALKDAISDLARRIVERTVEGW